MKTFLLRPTINKSAEEKEVLVTISLIERLSIELTKEYGSGFKKTNLKAMRKFYECFPIGQTLSDQLNWSHYQLIMRIENPVARDYYINEVITRQLSVRELERLIKTNTYEREKSNQITYEESKKKVVSYVNTTLLFMYWNIGKRIVEYQKGEGRAKCVDRLIERLSIELISRYGSGFDKSNLWLMVQLYDCFPILDSLRRELSWTHYRYIMRVDSLEARDY